MFGRIQAEFKLSVRFNSWLSSLHMCPQTNQIKYFALTKGKYLKHQLAISLQWPICIVNLFDKTKSSCYTPPLTQHQSLSENLPSLSTL